VADDIKNWGRKLNKDDREGAGLKSNLSVFEKKKRAAGSSRKGFSLLNRIRRLHLEKSSNKI